MSIPGEREKAAAANKFQTICSKLVGSASEMAENIISDYTSHNVK